MFKLTFWKLNQLIHHKIYCNIRNSRTTYHVLFYVTTHNTIQVIDDGISFQYGSDYSAIGIQEFEIKCTMG